MYFRKKTSAGRAYLQIVESRREGAAVRQQVIATLGRIEDLQESGQLERLLRSGARFAEKAIGSPVEKPALRPALHRIGVRHPSRPTPMPGAFFSNGSCTRSGGIATWLMPISSP